MDNKQLNYSPLGGRVGIKDYVNYDSQEHLNGLMIYGFITCILAVIISLPFMGSGEAPAVGILTFLTGLVMLSIGFWLYIFTLHGAILFKRFADINGMEYRSSFTPEEKGIIFQLGRDRHSERVVSGQYRGREFWFGTHYYTIRSGKYEQTIPTAVINVTLPRAVPHVILDGRQNHLQLGREFDRSQRFELEGDFGKYFTVYCPKDYERDVLYFLTPELMQVLINLDDKYDIEVIDHELYLYSGSRIKPSEKQINDIFTLIDTLGGEISENTERYRDWRVAKGLDTVAPAGMQLKRSFWPGVISVVVLIAYIISLIVD
ncbi:MAG TPA: hypothetical protein VF733_01380 [Candidatus Saccharimonadales bacterium]